MQTIRSFIAIPLAKPIRVKATKLIDSLTREGDGIRWVPKDNLHLTLKFLGEVKNTEVPRVCDILRVVTSQHTSFELTFGGLGGFPSLDRARVVCVNVDDPSGKLCQIVAELESKLADIGFKPEPRDYVPHLTLGRTKKGSRRASNEVIERITNHQAANIGVMEVDTVQMIASFLEKQGASYQVMDTIVLL